MNLLRKTSQPEEQWELVAKRLEEYMSAQDLEDVTRAYRFSQRAHKFQKRKTGEPFIVHPLGVAYILAGLRMDAPTIMSAFLHDVDEDTRVQAVHIQATFGDEIMNLVEALTNLDHLSFKSKEYCKAESLRRLLIAMSNDIRVVFIKLSDRLDNMYTVEALGQESKIAFAKETRNIYAPIAHRLGIYKIKWQLEDLCFKTLEPDKYALLKQKVMKKRKDRETKIQKVIAVLKKEFKKNEIAGEITGRAKSLFSIWQKMERQNKNWEEIYDVNAIRIIVDTIEECYRSLGIVHALWRNIPFTFDDYISSPKTNSYQSLHTAVLGPGNEPLEIQIRTKEMHRTAEYGIAAHWKYKENRQEETTPFDTKLSWLRECVETHKNFSDSREFIRQVMVDVFGDEVYVQTPAGHVVELPKGSCCLDFAYKIHTEIGHRCVGAKINGKITSLDTQLKNGDRVEILTSRSARPSPDWLNIVYTSYARGRIRNFFRRQKKKESTESGEKALMYELMRAGFRHDRESVIQKILPLYHCPSPEKLYSKIGYGDLSAAAVAAKAKVNYFPSKKHNGKMLRRPRKRILRAGEGVLVEGMPGIVVRISRCCTPVMGDPIVGYSTGSRGIAIHHQDCPNLVWLDREDRAVQVSWDCRQQLYCSLRIHIEATDQIGLLSKISACLEEEGINVRAAKVKTTGAGVAIIFMVIDVENVEVFKQVSEKIMRIEGVWKIRREFEDIAKAKK